MSHKTTHRGALPVPTSLECPLASLGRNSNAVMDSLTGHHHHHHHQPPPYHHPLSSSPLNPQVYQMSRNSPVLSIAADDIIYTSSVSQQGDAVNSLNYGLEDIDDEEATMSASAVTTSHTRARLQQLYQQQHQQQRSRSSSPSSYRQTTNFDYHRRHDMNSNDSSSVALNHHQHNNHDHNHHHHQQQQQQRHLSSAQQRNLLALDLEHLLQYGAGRPPKTRTAYLMHSTSNGHNSEDSSDAAPTAANGNDTDYLEKKMDDLYLGSAMRGLPIGSETNHFQNDSHFFLDEGLRNMCDYNNGNNHLTANGHLVHHQRASSPSETSGSDRYLLNRTSSPANAFSSSNNNTSTSNLALDQQRQLQPHQHVHQQLQLQQQQQQQQQHQKQLIQPQPQRYHYNNNNNNNNNNEPTNNDNNNEHNNNNNRKNANNKISNLANGFCNLGRFSPSLDQGYATLVSPSPTTGHHPNHITTHSIVHQPPQHTVVHVNKNMAISATRGRRDGADDNTAQLPPWNKKGPFRSGPYFDRLNDDAVLHILSWLDSCEVCNVARVCRRFEQLAWRPILWRVISLKGEHLNGDKTLKMIFRQLCGQSRNGACSEVERVLLSDGCRISDKGLQLLMRRCPELTHLQLHNCVSLSNQALIDVLTKCSNLQHLDVTGCTQVNCISPNPNIEPPRRLLLQYLDLSDCMALDDLGIKILVKYCPQLVYLYLRRCIQVTDAGLKFVPSFCVALKELSVSDCVNITDFGLYELAKLGAALRYLSVAKCDRVSDAGLKVIARRCYKLRYLNARGCEAVSDDSITVLAHSCPRLRALDIGKCDVSDAGLRALAESCPNLKKLSLRNCDMITDRGVQCIAYYCRGLQQLNIQDCQISIEGYRAVKKYCRRCIIEHTNPGFC